MIIHPLPLKHTQHGVAAVEFALVATILFALLFCIIEFGRLFFTINSMQEITRRAAREQVVNWVSASSAVQRVAVLHSTGGNGLTGTKNFPNVANSGTVNFPGSPDITNVNVILSFHNSYATALSGVEPTLPADPDKNIENCLSNAASCIRFVRATLTKSDGAPLDFNVIAPYMPAGTFKLPRSTVIMPAEALGLR